MAPFLLSWLSKLHIYLKSSRRISQKTTSWGVTINSTHLEEHTITQRRRSSFWIVIPLCIQYVSPLPAPCYHVGSSNHPHQKTKEAFYSSYSFSCRLVKSPNKSSYPLVICYIAVENHHFRWTKPLFLWPFSIVMSQVARGVSKKWWLTIMICRKIYIIICVWKGNLI